MFLGGTQRLGAGGMCHPVLPLYPQIGQCGTRVQVDTAVRLKGSGGRNCDLELTPVLETCHTGSPSASSCLLPAGKSSYKHSRSTYYVRGARPVQTAGVGRGRAEGAGGLLLGASPLLGAPAVPADLPSFTGTLRRRPPNVDLGPGLCPDLETGV